VAPDSPHGQEILNALLTAMGKSRFTDNWVPKSNRGGRELEGFDEMEALKDIEQMKLFKEIGNG